MIRKALPADVPELTELWDAGFPGEHDYGIFIFDRFFDTENILVYELDGRLAAMLLMLPRRIVFGNFSLPVSYVMGVTTRPDMRGKGIMGGLIEASHDHMRLRGDGLAVLIPANAGLFDYYARFGYKPFFRIDRKTVKKPATGHGYEVSLDSADLSAFEYVYSKALAGGVFIERTENDWACCLDEFRNFGGNALLLSKENMPVSYAFYGVSCGKLTVNEALGIDEEAAKAAVLAVFEQSGIDEAEILTPASANEGTPCGCALALNCGGKNFLSLNDFSGFTPYINLIHN